MRARLALGMALGSLVFAAPAVASPASELAAQEGITVELAERDLAVQQEAPDMVERERAALGQCYAGTWFNNKTGYFMEQVAPGCSKAAASEAATSLGVNISTRYPAVKHTYAELKTKERALVESLMPYEQAQQVQVETYTQANVVRVRYATGLSTSTREAIKAQAASVGATTTTVKASSLIVQPTGSPGPECGPAAWATHYCSPMRGGVRIDDWRYGTWPVDTCSAGFVVEGSDGADYMTTAGHCVAGGSSAAEEWRSGNETFSAAWCLLGAVAAYPWVYNTGGDMAVMPLSGCQPHEAVVQTWGEVQSNGKELLRVGNHYPPQNMSCLPWVECRRKLKPATMLAYAGLFQCHAGERTGLDCGLTQSTDLTVPVLHGGEGVRPPYVEHEDRVGMPVDLGDSGGAGFAPAADGWAYATGIVSLGYVPNGPTFLFEVGRGTEQLGVRFR